MEAGIDALIGRYGLPDGFVIPGASVDSATVHIARAVCRRCERTIVTLGSQEKVSDFILTYINRLSDMLFVLAWSLDVRGVVRQVVKETLEASQEGEGS